MERANTGDVVILTSATDDRVRAMVRLDSIVDTYLFVGRFIDSRAIGYMERTQSAVAEYERLEGERVGIQTAFALIFGVVTLLLLLAAVWVGLAFATQLVRPIGNLVAAAERVRAGDLSARVTEGPADDEIGTLSRAFNRMTDQVESQRRELIDAHRQTDARRRFTESVLSGVSAGVIGLDSQGRIELPNRSALVLLSSRADTLIGRNLADAVPEMGALMAQALKRPDRRAGAQVTIVRGRRTRTLLVRIGAERLGAELEGFVVTFDDITELVAAQRTAAWADVARRIAHEIKNPLTPIQLSAERIKRKYGSEISSDPEVFNTCTEMIVRRVGDIRRMVDEFSAFARMPAPVFKPEDLNALAQQAIELEQVANPQIEFVADFPVRPTRLRCDSRQVVQALTNLLRNAVESIAAREPPTKGKLETGRISIEVARAEDNVAVEVCDNGVGLPSDLRDRLTEPYVTTRFKGTGLGLAIVKKIMEDHGGELTLEDGESGGACVRLSFDAGRPETKADEAAPALLTAVTHDA
jgi:two-component system nitrogen regulation sensor histidine kinase NtrY